MPLTLIPKPATLDEFIRTCTPLAIIPSLEEEYRSRVEAIAQAMLQYASVDNPVENLALFLKADRNFLGIILALTNLSQEKFLRILSAERFANNDFGREWTIKRILSKITNEDGFAERIAQLFLEGRNSLLLVQQVAAFYLDLLALPDNWDTVIRDPQLVQNVIRRKLAGEYTDRKGDAIESVVRQELDRIQQLHGVPHMKGQVIMVGKEVDHALPSLDDPYVMIMSSYMETASSNQTTRANEQSAMIGEIQQHNRRYGTRRILVNFVDGAGWLARRSDLRKLYDGCDYILNLNTLDRLEAIICRYVPERFFTAATRPQVEG